MRTTILAVVLLVISLSFLPQVSEAAGRRVGAQARAAAQRELARMRRQGRPGAAGYYWWQGPGYYQWSVWSYRGY